MSTSIISNNITLSAQSTEAHLNDIEKRVDDLLRRSNNLEQKAYAVDHSLEYIFDACAENVGSVYTIVRERAEGAIHALLYGSQQQIHKEIEG